MKRQTAHIRNALPAFTDIIQDRQRITEVMREAVKKPLTVISAGTGFGKAQAASTLYDMPNGRVIWMQLTKIDNHSPRLWERLCDGIRLHSKSLSAELGSIGFPESLNDYHLIFQTVAETVARSKHQIIVIFEDIDVIHEPKIIEMIEYTVSLQINGLSIVLISDGRPEFNLAAFDEKGMLSTVNQEVLRLTQEEIADCFELQDIEPDEFSFSIEEIYDWTYGWPFAVYLIALGFLRGGFSKDDIYSPGLLDMHALIEMDIMQKISGDTRRFLQKLIILESVPAALLKALAKATLIGKSELDRMYHMLLRFEAQSGCYQVMPLFRELLLERYNDLSDAETAELYLTAAAWYREHDDELRAINYYCAGNDYVSAFEIILEHTHRLPSETAGLFIRIIDEAPPEAAAKSPVVLVARVRFLINNGRVEQAHSSLLKLRIEYEVLPDSKERNAVLGEIYIMSGIMGLIYKTLDFAEFFKRADALLPEGSRVVNRQLALAGGSSFLTTRDLGPDSVKRMVEALFVGMPHAVRVMHGCGAGLEYFVAAEVEYMAGAMKIAEKHAYAALYQAQVHEQLDIEYMALFILLRVATYKGDTKRAAALIETVSKYFKRKQTPLCSALCDIVVSGFYVPLGRCDKVAEWIREASDLTRPLAPISLNRGQWIRARCLLNQGRYSELLNYLNQLDELYAVKYSLVGLIEDAVMRAIALYYSGEYEDAFEALDKSYRLACENKIIMCHVEFGKWTRTLVRAARMKKSCRIPHEWLDLIYTKSSIYAKRLSAMASGMLGEGNERSSVSLSRREQDLLLGLCQGLTREELALTYGISINTVKRMIPTIYDKLGATNNLDAVRIATSLNLMA